MAAVMYRSPESLWCDPAMWLPTPAESVVLWALRVALVAFVVLWAAGAIKQQWQANRRRM